MLAKKNELANVKRDNKKLKEREGEIKELEEKMKNEQKIDDE
mgnify:CR=1 FL=1